MHMKKTLTIVVAIIVILLVIIGIIFSIGSKDKDSNNKIKLNGIFGMDCHARYHSRGETDTRCHHAPNGRQIHDTLSAYLCWDNVTCHKRYKGKRSYKSFNKILH